MKTNQKGFSVVEVLIVVVIVGLIGTVGWFVYDRQKSKNNEQPVTQNSQQNQETIKQETKADANEGYLVVKEWGLRFKMPSNITDVQYRVYGDTVAFYAKPTGSAVAYRSDYEAIYSDEATYGKNNPKYAKGTLYRSAESSKDKVGTKIEGKKIGNYYYYTAHAFSSLSTGAGFQGLYFDTDCDKDSTLAKCDPYIEAESKVFQALNQGDTALLNTIELAQ